MIRLSPHPGLGRMTDALAEQCGVVHLHVERFHDAVEPDQRANQEDAVARRFVEFVLERDLADRRRLADRVVFVRIDRGGR